MEKALGNRGIANWAFVEMEMGNGSGNWEMENGNGQFFLPYSSCRILLAVFFSQNEYDFENRIYDV